MATEGQPCPAKSVFVFNYVFCFKSGTTVCVPIESFNHEGQCFSFAPLHTAGAQQGKLAPFSGHCYRVEDWAELKKRDYKITDFLKLPGSVWSTSEAGMVITFLCLHFVARLVSG